MFIKTNIERPYLKKANIYLVASTILLLLSNFFVYKLKDPLLLNPPMENLSLYWGIITAFYLVLSFVTVLYSLKRSHLALFMNLRNDSLTYFFLLILAIVYLYRSYIYDIEDVLLGILVITAFVKSYVFFGIFLGKKAGRRRSDVAIYFVLFTVLILSLLSKRGIDLNMRLFEIELPPSGFFINKEEPSFEITPEKPFDADGLIVVSYLANAPNVEQDSLISYIHVLGEKGKRITLGISAGRETAEIGFGFPAIGPYIKHKQTEIYSWSLSNIAGVDYIHSYRYKQRYNFESPMKVRSIEFEFVFESDLPDPVKLVVPKIFYFRSIREGR